MLHKVVLLVFSGMLLLTGAAEVAQTVVLITGCSTGIGRATALKFAANPAYKVWATMRRPNSFQYYDTSTVSEVSDVLLCGFSKAIIFC
jgi:hypothetical protein